MECETTPGRGRLSGFPSGQCGRSGASRRAGYERRYVSCREQEKEDALLPGGVRASSPEEPEDRSVAHQRCPPCATAPALALLLRTRPAGNRNSGLCSLAAGLSVPKYRATQPLRLQVVWGAGSRRAGRRHGVVTQVLS